MTTRHVGALVLTTLLLVAACGRDTQESGPAIAPESAATTSTSQPTATSTPDATTTSFSTTSAPEHDESPEALGTTLSLRTDGLGAVGFGESAEEVLAVLEDLVGRPPQDPGDAAEWVEYVGWADLGFFFGFSQPAWSEYDGVSRFVGWSYGPYAETLVLTEEGLGVGSTVAELHAAYGDRLQLP